MKRLLVLLMAFLMTVPAAMAQTTILGHMSDGEYIHQYAAPNGQLLWFTSSEEEPHIKLEDVNFDGHQDIVIFVTIGASNFFAEFFVYDAAADMYTLARHRDTDLGICNYQLNPEWGIVASQTGHGAAGALHEYRLYRWEGTNLQLIRSALSEEKRVRSFENGVSTETVYTDILYITVRNHELGDYDSSLVWEKTIVMDEEEYRSANAEEMEALWQGIR